MKLVVITSCTASKRIHVPAQLTREDFAAIRTGRDPRTVGFSDAQVQDLRNRARFAARAALILEAVAKTENLAVTDADVDKKYAELADQRGQSVEAVRGWFGKEDAVQELRDRILEEKTLDWLLERANLVDA